MRHILVVLAACLAADVVEVNSEAFFIPKFSFLTPTSSSSSSSVSNTPHRLRTSPPRYRQVKSYSGNSHRQPNYPVHSPQKPSSGYRAHGGRGPLRQPYAAAARPVSKPHQQYQQAPQQNYVKAQKLDYSGWTPIGFDENAPLSSGSKYQNVDVVTLDVAIANAPYAQSDDYAAPLNSYSQPPQIITNAPTAPVANTYSAPKPTNSYSAPSSNSYSAPAPPKVSNSYSAPAASTNSYSAPANKNPVRVPSSYGAPVPAVPYIQSTAEQAASISKPQYRPSKPSYNKPQYKPKPSYKPQPKPQYSPFKAEPAVPKPQYNAPAPAPQYSAPAPAPQYNAPAPAPQYSAPAPATKYNAPAPAPQYSAPAPAPQYSAPAPVTQYNAPAPAPQYSAPKPQYNAPAVPPQYSAPAPAPVAQYSAPANPPTYEASAPSQPTGLYNAPSNTPAPSYLAPQSSYSLPQSKSLKFSSSSNSIKSVPTKAPVILPNYTPAPSSYDPLSFGDKEFPIISLITDESDIPEEQKYVSFSIGSESKYNPQYKKNADSNKLKTNSVEDSLQDELYYIYYQDPVEEEAKAGYGKRNTAKAQQHVSAGEAAPAHDIPLYDYDDAEIDLLRQPRGQDQQEFYLDNYRNIGGHSSVSVNFDVGGTNQGYSFHLRR